MRAEQGRTGDLQKTARLLPGCSSGEGAARSETDGKMLPSRACAQEPMKGKTGGVRMRRPLPSTIAQGCKINGRMKK